MFCLKELGPVIPPEEVVEHGVGLALVAAESALVVRLYLVVVLRDELIDVLEPYHWLLGVLNLQGEWGLRKDQCPNPLFHVGM